MEKINVAELLKDCPKGMELDCTIYDNVTLISVDGREGIIFPIKVGRKDGVHITLTKYGQLANADYAKCVIYPKGKTTWEGFVPPCKFKDGDILTNKGGSICIYKGTMYYSQNLADFYCGYRISDHTFIFKKFKDSHFGDINEMRLASEIEKQHFFQILLDNGYKWNPKTKTLEKLIKPRFKVGDRIKLKKSALNNIHVVTKVNKDGSIIINDYSWTIKYEQLNYYELIPNKFDVNTLVPFESRVLVRDLYSQHWKPAIYGDKIHSMFEVIGGNSYCQCIPYEGNEHLRGTTTNCEEYYRTWE